MARQIRRFSQRSADGDLFAELRDVLLEGWGCPVRPEHLTDGFRIFTLDDDQLGAAWRRHRQTLLREAARRGVAAPWGARFDEAKTPGPFQDC